MITALKQFSFCWRLLNTERTDRYEKVQGWISNLITMVTGRQYQTFRRTCDKMTSCTVQPSGHFLEWGKEQDMYLLLISLIIIVLYDLYHGKVHKITILLLLFIILNGNHNLNKNQQILYNQQNCKKIPASINKLHFSCFQDNKKNHEIDILQWLSNSLRPLLSSWLTNSFLGKMWTLWRIEEVCSPWTQRGTPTLYTWTNRHTIGTVLHSY